MLFSNQATKNTCDLYNSKIGHKKRLQFVSFSTRAQKYGWNLYILSVGHKKRNEICIILSERANVDCVRRRLGELKELDINLLILPERWVRRAIIYI